MISFVHFTWFDSIRFGLTLLYLIRFGLTWLYFTLLDSAWLESTWIDSTRLCLCCLWLLGWLVGWSFRFVSFRSFVCCRTEQSSSFLFLLPIDCCFLMHFFFRSVVSWDTIKNILYSTVDVLYCTVCIMMMHAWGCGCEKKDLTKCIKKTLTCRRRKLKNNLNGQHDAQHGTQNNQNSSGRRTGTVIFI